METCAPVISAGDVSTPTMVRSRPKLPTMRATSPAPGALTKTTSDPSTDQEVEDLVKSLSSLGNTDYIGKYSRRRRSGVSPSPSCPLSPMSPLTNPSTPGTHTPPVENKGMATITLTRMRSIKLKLEKVKAKQDKEASHSNIPKRRTGIVDAPQMIQVEPKIITFDLHAAKADGEQDSHSGSSKPSSDTLSRSHDSASLLHGLDLSTAAGNAACMTSSLPSDSLSTMVDTNTCAHADGVHNVDHKHVSPQTSSEHDENTDTLTAKKKPQIPQHLKENLAKYYPGQFIKSTPKVDLCVRETDDDLDEGVGEEPANYSPMSRSLEESQSFEDSDNELRDRVTFVDEPLQKSGKGSRSLTHPPAGEKIMILEPGSMDSNGLGSLRETLESLQTEEGMSEVSTTSTDSHICKSDTGETPSYRDIVLDVTSESTDSEKVLERRNGKGQKQKSKSDPVGETQTKKDKLHFTPIFKTSSQSTPLLRGEAASSQDTESDSSLKKERRKSKSDDILGQSPYPDEGEKEASPKSLGAELRNVISSPHIVTKPRRSSKKRNKQALKEKPPVGKPAAPKLESPNRDSPTIQIGIITEDAEDQEESADSVEDIPVRSKRKDKKVLRSFTAPTSPLPSAPLHKLEKRTALTIPMAKKSASSLARSHSSASVLLFKDRQSPQGVRPKDLAEKARRSQQDLTSLSSAELKEPVAEALPPPPTPASKGVAKYSPKLEPMMTRSSLSLFDGPAEDKEKRDLIVEELAYTERQYVETLHMLVEKYMIPMKTQGVLDSNLVDDIFYKINEIYMHHATFLAFLEVALNNWDNSTTIGDHILRTFSKQTVTESYMSFIENFPRAEKVLDDLQGKSSFQRFIEQVERETKNKLPLKAQIVKPAQRIPRYELLLKRLLENTPEDHVDHAWLVAAEQAIHDLALKINSVKQAKTHVHIHETLMKLELLLTTDLVVPDRMYIRNDMVLVLTRKDQCCVWLFSDLVIFTSIKRKSGPVNKKATLLLQSVGGQDFVENTKHKVWLKTPLEDMDIIQTTGDTSPKNLVDRELLESDFALLAQISDISRKLSCTHQSLEENVGELINQVNRQLSEHQLKGPPPEANKVELLVTNREGVIQITVIFPTPDKKASWENTFREAKQKLVVLSDSQPPEFMQALQITKTRAGMQFSCAAPIEGLNANQYRDVWVCNSDGYVGHMCLLSLQPEPIVTLNTPVPGCNSRILCICAIPGYQSISRKGSGRRNGVAKREKYASAPKILVHSSDQEEDEEDHTSDSSSNSDNTDETDEEFIDARDAPNIQVHFEEDTYVEKRASLDDSKGPLSDPSKGTMWLGTEDGCIHIFLSSDNIKTTKNKVKIQQAAPVLCIIHLDLKVFVALANGSLLVYRRNEEGIVNVDSYDSMTLGSATSPVNRMLAVSGKLWCATQNEIVVLNTARLEVETRFVGNRECEKPIQCLACSGQGVWVAGQGSSKLQLFHATTFEHLLEVSIGPAVALKLHTADDIIRQHKTACLRITTLLTCKDLLWVGTSAGVILNLTMPKVTAITEKYSITTPTITGLVHGHTGHVRFLTCVDLPRVSQSAKGVDGDALAQSLSQHLSSKHHGKMLVISGGDGYEDFRNNSNNEAAGKDDSTNHLLLWFDLPVELVLKFIGMKR